MAFVKLGFRNLFRQKRRTLITLIVITFGIGCLLLTVGHSVYIEWGLRESTIHSETGHLQVFNEDYLNKEENMVLQYGLENYEELREELMGFLDVYIVMARIELMGLISNGDKSVACIGQGIEPKLEKKLRKVMGNNAAMYDPLLDNAGDDIISLGIGLANSLNAKEGDYLTLLATTADGALNAVDVRVVGSFDSGTQEYNDRAVIIPLKTAQMLLNTKKVKNLLVTLDDTDKTDRYYNKIAKLSETNQFPVKLKRWHELAKYFSQVKQFYKQATGFLTIILFIIVFFSTSNTIVMSTIERTTEIGTLLSIGTSRFQTLKMFFFEGFFIGIIGGILSIIFAYSVSGLINYFDIRLSPPPGMTDGYPLQIRNVITIYIKIFLGTVLVASISSLVPAFKVTRMKIVDALGHI